jgi:hypothetical protein
MNYPANTWQELNWDPAVSAPDFFNFCSSVTDMNAPADIADVDYVLAKHTNGEPWVNLGNYANYFKQAFLPLCPSGGYDNTGCLGLKIVRSSMAIDNSN